MRRSPTRVTLFLALLFFTVGVVSLPGVRQMAGLLADEAADAGAFLPAVFSEPGLPPQPSPSPTLPPGTTATATRPPKATPTPSPTVIGTKTPTPTATATPLVTNTPISIGSPTPGLTPMPPTATPTATPQTSIARVLPNHSAYVDLAQDLNVVGEVRNTGAQTIQFVNIKAKFYSAGGKELDDAAAYAPLNVLAPGDKTCFRITLPLPPGYARYEFTEVTHLGGGGVPALAVSNVVADHSPATGFYNLAGKITNNEPTTLINVTAIGTLYDSNGIVRACEIAPAWSTTLPAGDFTAFELSFTGRNYSDVTTHRVQADGEYPE